MTNLANLPAATSLIDIHGSKATAATSRKLMAASEALNETNELVVAETC